MSQIPEALRYTKEHEWVAVTPDPKRLRMGITDFAQSALGDIVYVQLPKVGDLLVAGKVCGEVESTKSVSEIYAPLTGAVVAVNESLTATPEILNSDPYGNGWIAEIEITVEPTDLLSASEYTQLTA
ncbi:MAG: glycine cleavage system protein GcvH [Actinomycetota bacterium]